MKKKENPANNIAIIGFAFRFPGDMANADAFWDALLRGQNLVTRIDASRWAVDELQHPTRAEPGRSITYAAGVLSHIDQFDADFFGISPREAELLDPQQRVLLELTWESMENAGIKPSSLAGTDCAVYLGISGLDYGMRILDDLSSMAAHTMTGNTLSVAANRLSYVFDLHGPSLAVDTACSSSLVALHHACTALRTGQAPTALVGGINLLLHPYPFFGFTKASMLSSQGCCRPFGDGGDGYVRAEGGAMLLLKPLAQAVADGNPIHAVIRATGVNADGSRKSGLTIPSADGQAELLQRVLREAGLRPDEIDFIEAHGTGTKIGDPIEAEAISRAYGRIRSADRPLLIGSVKGNLGHMEPASGTAGLVKALLALRHRTLPGTLHAAPPNPAIDFQKLNLQVAREAIALHHLPHPLRAGVNSFGFGGVNAHVILEEYLPATTPSDDQHAVSPVPQPSLVLSARNEAALRELAGRYAPLLGDAAQRAALAQAAWEQRDWLPERLALSDLQRADAAQVLAAYAAGESPADLLRERALTEPAKVAFVYSGNGAQWLGMGRTLLQSSEVFAKALKLASEAIRRHGGPDILTALADDTETALEDTAVAQPALFALQVALTELLRSLGLNADAAIGHSVGEIAAAWAVGGFSLDAAAQLVVARSQAQAPTRGAYRMAAVGLGAEATEDMLDALGLQDRVEIAAENSPRSVTVSGARDAVQALGAAVLAHGTPFKELDLEYAFHSHFMDPIRGPLESSLGTLHGQPSKGRFFSSISADELDTQALDATYWWRNVRDRVRFGPAIAKMADAGYRVFVEVGPHAILQRYLSETLEAVQSCGRALYLCKRGAENLVGVRDAVLRAALLGSPIDPRGFFPARLRAAVALPNYPWQRQRYWYKPTSESYALIQRHTVHPLLGYRLKEPRAGWEIHLNPLKHPWLAEHRVGGGVVLPGAAYAEMALAASREWFGGDSFVVEGLDIVSPVVFDGEHARTLRFVFIPDDLRFRIEGRQRLSEDAWTLHARGRLLGAPSQKQGQAPRIERIAVAERTIDADAHYALASRLGLAYGSSFRGIQQIQASAHILNATLAWPPQHAPATDYLLAPELLDQCFQAVLGWLDANDVHQTGFTFLPVGIGRLTLYGKTPTSTASALRARLSRRSPRSVLVDFELLDATGAVLAELSDCRFRAAALAADERLPAAWRVATRLQPLPSDPTLAAVPCSADIARAVRDAWTVSPQSQLYRRYLDDIAPLVEQLPIALAQEFFLQKMGDGTALGVLIQAWQHGHPLLRWLLGRLRDEGIVLPAEQGCTFAAQDLPPWRAIWESVQADCPAALPELLPIGRVGLALPGLMQEACIPSILAHNSTEVLLESQAPAYAYANFALAHAIAQLARHWPCGRPLRLLDLGCDEGTLYADLRPRLPAADVDYVLVRDDAEVLAHLQQEHAHDDRVTVAGMDGRSFAIEWPQHVPAAFDIVIVHHLLHRAAQPTRVLAALRECMADDAVLFVAERHPDNASQCVFGTHPAWWHDDGEHAPQGSLLGSSAWRRLLRDAGWRELEAMEAQTEVALGTFLLAARPAPRAVAPTPVVAQWALAVHNPRWQPLADALVTRLLAARQAAQCVENTDAALASAQHLVLFPDVAAPHLPAGELAVRCEALRRTLLQAAARKPALPVVIVTQGGVLADADKTYPAWPAAGALWGLVRVAANELPDLRLRLVDLAGAFDQPVDAAQRLALELLQGDGEEEVVLGLHSRRVTRVRPLAQDRTPPQRNAAPAAWRLDFNLAGQLRHLHWRACQRRDLGPDEVEIEAHAAGLNFRDVMYAQGLLADEALEQGFAGPSLGLEVAGRISRCGASVTRFQVGDAVLAFAGASFASHVVVPQRALARKPAQWTFYEAATVPTVFFTVWYALKHLAHLQPGERLLVHGAAGGVGIAAIQVARMLGAEVYASAGNPEKRDFARLLGADHVLDSRSPHFDQAVLDLTAGSGVDVVLNSLAGEAIQRNLRALRPFGRFIELGKRDFYENTAIGLRPFRNNISYFGVDADQLMQARPELATRIFEEVMAQFAKGHLNPLPYRLFPADRIVDAFRTMQQSRHIGKIVVDLQNPPHHIVSAPQPAAFQARPDATYLVTGGLSGFGLATAAWLAERGARHLTLLGRRGGATPGLDAALPALHARGVTVQVHACDVTDEAQLAHVLAAVRAAAPPLRGVIHAAMVLDDALLANLDAARFERVLATKLDGARHLHKLTRDLALDFFVLYSSATTLLGNPGQANYVAANAALETLARLRRQQGLPACVAAWGPIADVGVLTRNAEARKGLEARLGTAALTSTQALAMLERMLAEGSDGEAVMNFQWNRLRRALPAAGQHRFDDLHRLLDGTPDEAPEADLRALLAQLDAEQAQQHVTRVLAHEVSEILRLPIDRLPVDQSLFELGMDSLMAVELALALEKRLGVTLPPMLISENPSIERIAQRVLHRLLGDRSENPDPTTQLVQTLMAQHAEGENLPAVDEFVQAVRETSESGARLTP